MAKNNKLLKTLLDKAKQQRKAQKKTLKQKKKLAKQKKQQKKLAKKQPLSSPPTPLSKAPPSTSTQKAPPSTPKAPPTPTPKAPTKINKEAILVLGNAKSLEDIPFWNYNIDTIGMNVAYRFWEQINWYPTYYVSLDKNVNINYGKDINRLIMNRKANGIKKFLLRKVILKKFPHLKKIKQVQFLENIKASKGFNNEAQITTGSFAVRWAVHLNYKRVYMLGIDSHYIPLKPQIDKNFRLTQTVNPQPNYFFVGYQRKGDKAHINLSKVRINHLETFQKINKAFNTKNKKRIINCNGNSKLHTLRIMPYKPFPAKYTKQTLSKSFIQVDKKSVENKICGMT